ncbi:MAG: peptide-methionine (S)-S-oxide reductase MsrA [Opitutales bacterium]|nr:peptide-methionine (S)-S-oxide reductase MsrA [Opitutales bacterium]MCH8540790.1 peptide-methionine (S)-S-oxide reductase MsrA [Opitutales bacterium]
MTSPSSQTLYLGAGCFWCTEAIFQQIDGVLSVRSGYMGGDQPNPTYEQICSGQTGHAEVIEVQYDELKVSPTTLLEIFWRTHNPTTLNRQGADIGTQYRSAIFYTTRAQEEAATALKDSLEEKGVFEQKIVTEITPASEFYPAEEYHQNYYRRQPQAPYCQMIITPKLEKLQTLLNS